MILFAILVILWITEGQMGFPIWLREILLQVVSLTTITWHFRREWNEKIAEFLLVKVARMGAKSWAGWATTVSTSLWAGYWLQQAFIGNPKAWPALAGIFLIDWICHLINSAIVGKWAPATAALPPKHPLLGGILVLYPFLGMRCLLLTPPSLSPLEIADGFARGGSYFFILSAFCWLSRASKATQAR